MCSSLCSLTCANRFDSFMGGGAFCFKVCDPAGPNAAALCQHVYDRIGCAYNSPNAAQNGTFLACDGADQDPAGIYTDASGAVQTYTQPDEALGPITTMPYQPRVPASSNCVTYTSAVLYAAAASDTAIPSSSSTPAASGPSSTGKPGGSSTKSGSAAGPSATGGASGTGAASSLAVSSLTSIFGVAFAVAFFA